MTNTHHTAAASNRTPSPTRVESRVIVSAPLRVIVVEEIRVSEQQQTSVASAIRAGRAARTSD